MGSMGIIRRKGKFIALVGGKSTPVIAKFDNKGIDLSTQRRKKIIN